MSVKPYIMNGTMETEGCLHEYTFRVENDDEGCSVYVLMHRINGIACTSMHIPEVFSKEEECALNAAMYVHNAECPEFRRYVSALY